MTSSSDWTLRAWIEWFKGETTYGHPKLPEKSESQIVSESLLHELDLAIREIEERNRARDQEERKRQQKVSRHDLPFLLMPLILL